MQSHEATKSAGLWQVEDLLNERAINMNYEAGTELVQSFATGIGGQRRRSAYQSGNGMLVDIAVA